MELNEIKEWLKVETDEEDVIISSLLSSAKANIESSTGIKEEYLKGDLLNLYNLAIKVWVMFMYEYDSTNDRNGNAIENFEKVMNGFYLKLEPEYLKLKRAGKI